MKGREVTLICEGEAYEFTSSDGIVNTNVIQEIESDQEETDTRIILYCLHAKQKGYKHVVVRSPDSDLFFILLSYIHDLDGTNIYFETGKKNKKRLINITELGAHYSKEYCKALLGLHAFTGCDSTSAFKGKGKVRAMKWMLKDDIILKAAAALGNEWTVSEENITGMERLACRLYGSQRINDVNECRYIKLTSACCPDDLNIINATKKKLTLPSSLLQRPLSLSIVNVLILKLANGSEVMSSFPSFQAQWMTTDGVWMRIICCIQYGT